MSRSFRLGPAVLVTAAFIGPGTVMTASRAGAKYGFTLLWAVVFSTFTAIVLQAMAARLGVATGQGISESLRSAFKNVFLKAAAIVLVLGAILFGNSAYQTGNILGAAQGISLLTDIPQWTWAIVIAIFSLVVIWVGKYSILQWTLTALVAVMGIVFLMSAILSGPSIADLAGGLRPTIPTGSEWAVIGLIGTTVVPYNLFLHASAASKSHVDDSDAKKQSLSYMLWDTIISILIGGAITAALVVTAAVAFGGEVDSIKVQQIVDQLRPALGAWSESAFAAGLFAAGLTSSLTAPVAAAYATAGCFGWDSNLSNQKMKIVATLVILAGLSFALIFGSSPTETIIAAQVANGLLLPIVAGFLIYTLNRSELMGQYRNGWFANILGTIVLLVTLVIATRQFNSVWTKVMSMFETAG